MDPKKPMEDHFSKLHPCMPVDTRIGIIGAGPSGLAAAYALAKLGYSNVTVLEKYHTVSGMCESVDIEGRIYDLGGQVIAANSAPVISHFAKETGSEFEAMDEHKLAIIDRRTGKYQDLKVADDYISVVPLTLKLQEEATNSGKIGIHALSKVAADPTTDFLKLNGLTSVPKSVAYGYTASGYGYVQDMPYAYIQEFTRTSMAGKIRRFREGYMSMWHKLSQFLPFEVICNAEVVSIRRNSAYASIIVKDTSKEIKTMEFDKIIVSGSLPFRNGKTYRSSSAPESVEKEVMVLNELEKELFSKVQTIDYYTTVLKIKGLEYLPMGFYYFGEFLENPATIGYPVAMQRFFADTDIFLFWSYGNSGDISGPTITQFAIDVVKNMGGQVEKVALQRRFKYFPHVKSEDMKDEFYEKLEMELQGFQNTYYVGGLMAFELTERNSFYSLATICKHFANEKASPAVPYVKRLFPLVMNPKSGDSKELCEFPGIQFPDLPHLDSYLRFWGTHNVTAKKTLYTWLNEEGKVASQRTYAELHANASYIAFKLLTNSKPVIKPGDRVLLVHLPGLEFVDAFFGCIRAGILPVPVLPPDPFQRGGQALLKIENVSKACNAVAILSTASYHTAVRAGLVKNIMALARGKSKSSARWPDLPWLHTDSWVKNPRNKTCDSNMDDVVSHCDPLPNNLCFLQFTSGSTGDAKGVMITHGGLIHNVKLMKKRYKSTSRTVLVSWLPQYHDMGLIGGLFTALVSGGAAILFSPMTFIKKPLLWLETMSKYHATHSAGPNFAFELMVRKLESDKKHTQTYDLSSMVFLMVSAEPVRQKTLKRFLEISHFFGLSEMVMAPGYGLAENCVFVSCAFGEGKPILLDWQDRVCCGYVDPKDSDVDIRIVDPDTGKECEDGKEGEIWICSKSAGIGYWGNPELSHKTFFNELENCPGRKFTRTGDLGRVIDKKLFITGRIKDLIIVAGRNIYSSDVEKTVESSSEILRPGCCAVVGVPEEILSTKGISIPEASDQVGLVVIAEVREEKTANAETVDQIKSRVAEEHGVPVASVELIKPRTISKTTSGKIRRFECLKQFADGTLSLARPSQKTFLRSFSTGTCTAGRTPRLQMSRNPSLPQRAGKSVKEIAEFLIALVSELTGISVEKISASENLVSYGIDSIGVVKAAQKLSDYLGVPIGAVDIFTATCISDLASFSENLLMKARPQPMAPSSNIMEPETEILQLEFATSAFQQLGIGILQLLALACSSSMLILPAYLSILTFMNFLSSSNALTRSSGFFSLLVPLVLAPLAWILYIFLTCVSLSFFGGSFLLPNYTMTPNISIWSTVFVKWWTLSKAQEMAAKVLAVHLRGTVFLNKWFEMLGAQVGSSVHIDTVDITDPYLVSIGDGTVISEGALIQSYDVENGVLSFRPIRIGRSSMVGPYSVVKKGSILAEGSELMPLQKCVETKALSRACKASASQRVDGSSEMQAKLEPYYHFMGIYVVGFISSLSAAVLYFIYCLSYKTCPSAQYFAFVCIAGAFHWFPTTLVAYATIVGGSLDYPVIFAHYFAVAYFAHGIILCLLTSLLTRFLAERPEYAENGVKTWLCRRLTVSCHLRFSKLLSGTEAFCIYLRLLGARIGRHCSIRAINPVTDPQLLSIGDGVHLGDFSRIVTNFNPLKGLNPQKIEICKNSVVGSQSVILPGSVIQEDVILGALSIAPANSTLQRGGVYMGSQYPVMVKNTLHALDERIEEMDKKYKKIVGTLAGNLAITTLKVKSRYFHRIGVSGRGVLKMYDNLPGFLPHKIFCAGKCFPVIVRHSNSLSSDDDARIDARGAALRILSETSKESPLLDLTLKTGNAFYARTIADFATWLVCGLPAREQFVKRFPHVRDAVWGSLRNAKSYAKLHYYSNICRLLRFNDGQEMFVKFKLQPFDHLIGENSGEVSPKGILPPETGAIPREENDTRPLLFLADDFHQRVASGGVRYIFQLQCHPIPSNEVDCDRALDCTRPWDENEFPYIDIGEIVIDKNLSAEESESLEFNPFLHCHEVDIIRANSSSQSASIDHGRSLVYQICQHLRNGEPLPAAWRSFLDQSDAKVDLSGCPMAAAVSVNKEADYKVTLKRTWYQTMWVTFAQPLLQTLLPYFVVGLVVFTPLKWLLFVKEVEKLPLHYLLPLFWLTAGIMTSLVCALAKWVLVGKKKDGERVMIWSWAVFMDTVWQALRTVVGDFFMDMVPGSVLFVILMKFMGSKVKLGDGVYVDSMGALLNPEMVEIEKNGCVGREAVLFGHLYEGEGGAVKFGRVRIGEGGFVGSRAVVMPGAIVADGGNLDALSLAMKGEIVRSERT